MDEFKLIRLLPAEPTADESKMRQDAPHLVVAFANLISALVSVK